jgi:cell division transport system ATP-binding protein
MIQFQNVKKEYSHNNFVLGELNLHIKEGEFVFIIGPSGSGKTSVIKLLIREEAPTSGQIYFEDYDVTKLTRDSVYKLRRYIGVVFQDYKLIADKTVYENVAFAMEVAGRENKEIKETVPYLLDIVGLSHRADAFPAYLSGGEKQRVAIARAVSNNPKVLVADEPTGNLDPAAAWDIVQILSKINNWGTTVIMSTHGTDIVNTLNKRVVQMQNGLIVRDDFQGLYEVTGKRDNADEQADSPIERLSQSQGPIKVRIKASSGIEEIPSVKKRILSKIWPFAKKVETQATPLEQEFGKVVDQNVAEQEFTQDIDQKLEQAPAPEVKEILQDADSTPIEKLNLRPEIIADLKTAGYEDIEDIISAGPEQLTQELVIDPEEVVLISRAVAEFIGNEESKYEHNSKVKAVIEQSKQTITQTPATEKPEPQAETAVPELPKPKKTTKKSEVRVDLTSKKKTPKNVE